MKTKLPARKPWNQRLGKTFHEGLRLWQDLLQFRPDAVIAKRYRIVRKLGTGSYGSAYLCRDIRSGRRCVLKRVCPLRGGRARAEFIYGQETAILRRLAHPGLPGLYEQFRYGEHLCFTMEYMEGVSLDRLLFEQERVFTEKEALQLVLKLLSIVGYMHSVGIVHRDISIANVLLHGKSVQLIDVGLSRELAGSQPEDYDPYEVDADDPSEKRHRRRIHVTSDFYAIGHLLLFLLYSAYPEEEQIKEKGREPGWEQELTLQPGTKKLLRRLLLTEQPYRNAGELRRAIQRLLPDLD
ncbi:serine/threonine protein kinase [Paenibacillus sp. TAB 01]|uniref:serine/threonine protein kinase n=1 Tax=Paenibacillus sp. TAB 01 TaxID=3368988 RepID=UPI0037539D39